jgi:hypothetical protein
MEQPCLLKTMWAPRSVSRPTEMSLAKLGMSGTSLNVMLCVTPLPRPGPRRSLSHDHGRSSLQSVSISVNRSPATMLTSYSPSRLPSRPLPPGYLLPLLRCHDPQAPNLPFFWRQWMHDLDPFTRLISCLVSTELHQLPGRRLESESKVSPDCFPSISFEKLVS